MHSGSFAVVKKGTHKRSGRIVAIKCIGKASLTAGMNIIS